jgi:hypothetical protein
MAQPPLLTDQIQIEPGSLGIRLIDRDSTDGSLRFTDPLVQAALSQLVGIRNVTSLYIVGPGGAGAPFTSIQDALDAIPDTASPSDPALVLLSAGEYSENLVINKDGVSIVGLGGVRITNAAADATVKVTDTPTTVPRRVVLQNLTIENVSPGEECVLVAGSGTYASGTALVNTAPLAAGDTLTIGGVTLTGVNGTRNSGSDNFSVDGTLTGTIAAEIMEAVNDPANSFAVAVVATYTGSTVTITALIPGPAGNAITLASVTTPPGGVTLSGPNLTGGSVSGSTVAEEEVTILDCNLVASGVAAYQVRVDTANNVRVAGGSWRGSSSTSLAVASQCASFVLSDIEWVNDLELAYDTVNPQPSITTSQYEVQGCSHVRNVLCNLLGAGSLAINQCPDLGDIGLDGDRALSVSGSKVGNLTLEGTTATRMVNSTRGTATAPTGTPTLSESSWTGSVAFVASISETVSFDLDQPDTSYAVFLDSPMLGVIPQVTTKTTTDFTIQTPAPLTGGVYYTVLRQM